MASRRFDPFDLFSLLEQDFSRISEMRPRFQFAADVYETDEALIVRMECPGVRSERLSITLSADDRTLIISGERIEDAEERSDRTRCYQLEIFYGTFERTISLPAESRFDREQIKASCKDGVLIVTLPHQKSEEHEKRIIPVTFEE